jgi:hypothetical protein
MNFEGDKAYRGQVDHVDVGTKSRAERVAKLSKGSCMSIFLRFDQGLNPGECRNSAQTAWSTLLPS